MIIYLNEERAYRSWITHHRQGFVLAGKRKPKIGQLVLHRATCGEVKPKSRRIQSTTGAKLKACGLERAELEAWALAEAGLPATLCQKCRPEIDDVAGEDAELHLTKLAADVLDYLLDAALIHMEHDATPYHLTIGDIAACFGKQPGQLAGVLRRLAADGLVSLEGEASSLQTISPKRVVLPTARALRTLEAFRDESDQAVNAELQKLH